MENPKKVHDFVSTPQRRTPHRLQSPCSLAAAAKSDDTTSDGETSPREYIGTKYTRIAMNMASQRAL